MRSPRKVGGAARLRRIAGLLAAAVLLAVGGTTAPARATISAPADTLRYVYLGAGRPTGLQKVWSEADGTIAAFFEFNDRGRGPSLTERLKTGPEGRPVSIEIRGNDYFKGEVEEHFSVAAGSATWSNGIESGSQPATDALYTSFYGAPEELAVMARALLAAPGRRLGLLPAGEARIESLGTLTVSAGGAKQTIVHFAIRGLDYTPTRLWLDRDRRLFASGSSWGMTIRVGAEAAVPMIVAAQDAASSADLAGLARRLARRPHGALAFRDAAVFDAATGSMLPHHTVVVSGSRIVAVGPTASVAVPRGAEVIEAAGKSLLPGLWDMHVHLGDSDGLFHIAAGVTSTRDLGNDMDQLLARRRAFDSGRLIGPRVVMAGIIDGPGPYAGPTQVLVDTPAAARAAVARYAAHGFVQIKIYSSVKPELVPVLVEEAHRRGLRVSGHIPAFMSAEQAVRAGYDEIQHANFLFLNFWADSVPDTRTPARFTAVGERAAGLDLDGAPVRDFIALLKQRHIAVDPTLNIFESLLTARRGTVSAGDAAIADRLPPQIRRGLMSGGLPVPEGMDQRYRDSFAQMPRLIKRLYDAGVVIEAGTDAAPGFALHRELELYSAAGIPNAEVLRLATQGAARVMGVERERGSIAAGKQADLVLVDGNPLERITDIRRTEWVVKDGWLYRSADLYQAMGVAPAVGSPGR